MTHCDILSFAVTLPDTDSAQIFMRRALSVLGCPVLRYDNVVHVIILDDNLDTIRTLAVGLRGRIGYAE